MQESGFCWSRVWIQALHSSCLAEIWLCFWSTVACQLFLILSLSSITRNWGLGGVCDEVSPPESGEKSHPLQKNWAFPVIVQGHIEELGPWAWARVAMPSLPVSLMPETVLSAFVASSSLFKPWRTARLDPLETRLKSHSETLVSKLLFDLLKTTHWKQSLLYPFRFNFD